MLLTCEICRVEGLTSKNCQIEIAAPHRWSKWILVLTTIRRGAMIPTHRFITQVGGIIPIFSYQNNKTQTDQGNAMPSSGFPHVQ